MNTSQLKSFAQQSRKALIDTVSGKLDYVLDENSLARRESASAVSALEGLIKEIGKEQVIEKVAYTWFNRFCALRYMDVNRYNKIGIVSPVEGQTQPEILAEAKMNYIDDSIVPADKIADIRSLLNGTKTSKDPQGEAYKLLFVSYCNSLNKQLPFMFEKISDYTELLLPDDLLAQNSVLSNTIEILGAETCKDIEVIGWLYQYYISEKKEEVFAELKKGKKISKENVPAATQIFTPKWIVSYMVENSVGKLWLESHPDERLQSQFKYYLESAEQEPEVQAKLDELINKDLKPQDIKVLDPACGSGHILVKAFDVLFEIYKSQGWQENEIPEMILKNNLYGLDICDRATQLAQFAVMMKAREYDRNIFNKVKELNICSIKDTNWIDEFIKNDLIDAASDKEQTKKQLEILNKTFKDAKIYGSLIKTNDLKIDILEKMFEEYCKCGQLGLYAPKIKERLPWIIKQAKIMKTQYECVITNPPYMGNKFLTTELVTFLSKYYNDSKNDLFSAFIEYTLSKTIRKGHIGLVTPFVWLFIKTYEELRKKVLLNSTFSSIIQLEYNAFEAACVPVATFTIRNNIIKFPAECIKLSDFVGSANQPIKTLEAISNPNVNYRYTTYSKDFDKITGSPIAYWASENIRSIFEKYKSLDNYADAKSGISTANNDEYLRVWTEIDISKSAINKYDENKDVLYNLKWFPYNKGCGYRKWYGNNIFLVNWFHDGYKLKNDKAAVLRNPTYYFKEGLTYSDISSSSFGIRYSRSGFLYDVKGSMLFTQKEYIKYLLGFMNTKIATFILDILNPTMSFQVGNLSAIPFVITNNSEKFETIKNIVDINTDIAKDDWDSFETSWDFQEHPLLRFKENGKVSDSFNKWKEYKQEQFNKLKANEEELNKLFIEIYGLKDEMTPEVDDKDITVALADEKREIKSLLSYAGGCMFGRYSLDEKGLAFAGGEFDLSKYKTFPADEDAVIPVLSEHLFSDDITSRFKEFLKVAFGETYFEGNLEYVASVLGKKNTETADDTIRNYFMKDFYNDHIKMYQKRPIYWMFSSPKGNFNALVYMHRYNKDTASVILNSYLRNYRDEKLKAQIENCKQIELSASTSQGDKIKASKRREELEKIVKEVTDYERDILYPLATERKEIDLDDGVKVNYLKFGKALKDFGLKAKK